MSRIFGEVGQLAWVVPDIRAAMEHWAMKLGIGPWLLIPNARPEPFVCDGKPSDLEISLAFAFSGDLQIELIQQHNDAPSLYGELASPERGAQHHLGYFVRDYDERRQGALDAGFEIGQEGALGGGSFCYFRTNEIFGTFSELILMNDQIAAGFEAQKAATRAWDGKTVLMGGGS